MSFLKDSIWVEMPRSLMVPLLETRRRNLMSKLKNIHKTDLRALYFAFKVGKCKSGASKVSLDLPT